MMYSNQKKIRGWKKQIKKIDAWYEGCREPNLESFHQREEDYLKIRIDPWNRLSERVPPQWYFRLMIEKLIRIYMEWQQEYKKQAIPFDLQIWLNDPHPIRSQVVCAKVGQPGERRDNYYRKSTDLIAFPIQKWQSDSYDLQDFEWELFDDENLEFENISGLNEQDIQELIRDGYQEEKTIIDGQEETIYSKKVGHVWIGRIKHMQ